MADLEERLSVLRGSPLAAPPPMADLERRARRLGRRRWTARGLGATVLLVAVVAGAIALTSGGRRTTVRTAAPSGAAAISGPVAPAAAAGPVVLKEFEAGGRRWPLVAQRGEGDEVCVDVVGTTSERRCVPAEAGHLAVFVADLSAGSLVFGMVGKDVDVIASGPGGAQPVDVLGRDAGFPVNFFGFVAAAGPDFVDLQFGTKAQPDRVRMSVGLPIHRRVDSVNGVPVPAPTTGVPPTAPSTVAPSTTAPPPATTVPPPIGGQAKRVVVTPGATNLQKHQFESAVASGAQSVLVTFWDGIEPCSVLGRVDLVEAADKVTITLWTGTGPGAEQMACIAIAQQKETLVTLAAALGSRTVVDGAK